jgi:pantoate--beta-alanine ligase
VNRVATRRALAAALQDARAAGRRIALVPTMGFLHEGHLSLCDEARRNADFVVMSIFVNPLQFGPNEDFERYPRDIERDASLADGRGVDLLFTPDVAEMYPAGETRVLVTAGALEDRLDGHYRPGHFPGVLTVVAKLFNLVGPDVAVFGQKDLQQCVLIRRMVRDLDFPVELTIAPIVREADGLALSSRNVYLSPSERAAAPALHRSLEAGRAAFRGRSSCDGILAAVQQVLHSTPGIVPQYVSLVDTETLEDAVQPRAGQALAVAAHLGKTRLIDNIIL